jgi:hypothetical protein
MTRASSTSWLVAVLLAVAGCAPVVRPLPTGSVWAFFTDTDLTLGPRAVIYTMSYVACETERQRRIGSTSSACVSVVVGPGTGYYAIALPSQFDATLPGGAIGTTDRTRCEQVRMDLFRAYSAMGDCEPVSVKGAR